MPLGAKREGPQAAQDEEAILRARDGAHRVLQEAQLVGDVLARGDDHPDHRVAVAGEVLGGRVEDDVGAERERSLQGRRGEGVVDHHDRRRAPCPAWACVARATEPMSVIFRSGFDGVSNQTSRVRSSRPLPAHPGVARRRQVDVARQHAAGPRDPLEEPIRAAVHVVADDEGLAGCDQLGEQAVAAEPEANAIPCVAPSRSATARSRRSRVGFWVRAYS